METRYTGMALNATARLADHNNGKNRFTKGHRPWKILYTEQCKDWSEGRVREKYLKTSGGKNGCRKDSFTEETRVPCLLDAVRQGILYGLPRVLNVISQSLVN
ncbi:MAG: GIY-YIG nuclease family protein [Saprospiraceae bacterium]|nr:GIY-YIG nuclease family protein [Saprospiraceae bacterium]